MKIGVLRRMAMLAGVCLVSGSSLAWDAYGHRTIAHVALEGLARQPDAPAWAVSPDAMAMISDEASTPDRWRSVRVAQLTHLNNPDHYLDVEELPDFGMSLGTLPRLRHEYVRALTLARAKPDFKGEPIDEKRDPARVNEYPGFLPFVACETYGKVVSAMRVIRILERANDPSRANQLAMARADAMVNMGVLAHYIGDAAQPLHTTIHHHGWVGENPKGYTTDKRFHSYIDGTVVDLQKITDADVLGACTFARTADANDPFDDVLAEIGRSHDKVEALYALEKSGGLKQAPGKPFIVGCMADGAETLEALYAAAWKASVVNEKDMADFWRYDHSGDVPKATPKAAPEPAKKP